MDTYKEAHARFSMFRTMYVKRMYTVLRESMCKEETWHITTRFSVRLWQVNENHNFPIAIRLDALFPFDKSIKTTISNRYETRPNRIPSSIVYGLYWHVISKPSSIIGRMKRWSLASNNRSMRAYSRIDLYKTIAPQQEPSHNVSNILYCLKAT